ncbi:MAG: PRTRC system ThiF family protein [Lentisphaerae bacterium]|nr:PRTRC system ThiF family protein [Lentisphaerota bacterium]
MKHYSKIPMNGQTTVVLTGCGGTGSQMLVMLARLDTALRGLGGEGLKVDCFDPDKVTEANAGRQSFYDSDIGRNKAEVLVQRLKLCFPGFEAQAHPSNYERLSDFGILISCVDSRKSRREICASRTSHTLYHIDCGNGADYGQVILGNGSREMPWPEKVAPELIADGPEDDAPSCSMAEALEKQELFVNDYAARIAGTLLWNLFRHGYTEIRGAYFNLNPVMVNPIKIEDTPDKKKSKGRKK